MDLKEIQNLIRFVAKSGASEVKLETGDVKITIRTGSGKAETTIIQQPQQLAVPAPLQVEAPAPAAPERLVFTPEEIEPDEAAEPEEGTVRDDDFGLGFWLGGGFFWNVNRDCIFDYLAGLPLRGGVGPTYRYAISLGY